VFEQIEGQGSKLDKVAATIEQHLEGPVTEKMIQYLAQQEAQAMKNVKESQVNLKAFEAALTRPK
jgi:hypothetical protein